MVLTPEGEDSSKRVVSGDGTTSFTLEGVGDTRTWASLRVIWLVNQFNVPISSQLSPGRYKSLGKL